jgi:F-type H+-transporting ATPase subunit b
MAILNQLGINQTIFFQFVIFVIAYITLYFLVFKPYTAALNEREARTKGGEGLASELQRQARDLQTEYEKKARQINGQIKEIFDQYRAEASKETDVVISKARSEAQILVERARQQVAAEISQAENKLRDEVPMVAQVITAKLLTKN